MKYSWLAPHAKHALLVAPVSKLAALLRLIDRKTAHYRKPIGIFLRRFEAVIDAVTFPRRRDEDGVLDADPLHHRAEFLICQRLRKMRLATGHPGAIRRFRPPDVNAGIDDHHWLFPSTQQPACVSCRRTVRLPTCGAV